MEKRPSLIKIITVDYAAFLAFIFPIVMWGMYIVLRVLDNEPKPSLFSLPVIFGIITIVAIIVVVWRIQLINSVFSDGIESMAKLDNVFFYRDRGKLEYIYIYMGEKYRSSNAVQKCKYTRDLQIGSEMVVMVDRNHPKRAYLRDLYS
jgi:low affinity Fe/Cu permease